ncbi:MAG: ROK family protein [Acidobacteriota bacterium]|nr:ROK family protein [Acidobacteriota bacterium]
MALIGVDLGGSQVRAGLIQGNQLVKIAARAIRSQGTPEEVLSDLTGVLDEVWSFEVEGIGLGVPSVVELETGTIYEVQNIPAWQQVPLKKILETRYPATVYINNDANCFVTGEKYFGLGRPYNNFVGLITGTGLGAGLIINNRLYSGPNCGAGEFGMLPYLEANFERYASGQFFIKSFGHSGQEFYQQAKAGEKRALEIFQAYGHHLGEAIKAIMYAVDPEAIILGGSVSQAYEFFKDSMAATISSFAYSPALNRIEIKVSTTENIAILGAAALYLDSLKTGD